MLLKIQQRWAGHVSRMEDHRLPKIILYGELSSGLRNRGAPKKRYKDTLKKSLGACNISHLEWTTVAEDRSTWRRTISKAASSFESSRRSAIEEKRQRRKYSAAITPNPEETFTCCHCNQTCQSRIGLMSHERACQETWTSFNVIFVRKQSNDDDNCIWCISNSQSEKLVHFFFGVNHLY